MENGRNENGTNQIVHNFNEFLLSLSVTFLKNSSFDFSYNQKWSESTQLFFLRNNDDGSIFFLICNFGFS